MSANSLVETSDPWLQRHYESQVLKEDEGPAASGLIQISDKEVYGDPNHSILFRIGNGGAGFTGLLKELAERYIIETGHHFRIAWVTNHSRHSEIALLADVVQIALLYEPTNEDIAIAEGWAKRTCRVFNDHFILVGPGVDLHAGDMEEALRNIARIHKYQHSPSSSRLFLTRGDGSATFAKEQYLFEQAGVDVTGASWIITHPVAPYDALLIAEKKGAFLLTDRATFLTAKKNNEISALVVHVQGGENLLNPCSALVKSDDFFGSVRELPARDVAAHHFARWLGAEEAQHIIEEYGRDWPSGKPLFTPACKEEFHQDGLL